MRPYIEALIMMLGYALAGLQVGGPVFVGVMLIAPLPVAVAAGVIGAIAYARFVERSIEREREARGRLFSE